MATTMLVQGMNIDVFMYQSGHRLIRFCCCCLQVTDGGEDGSSGVKAAGDTIAGRRLSPAERKFVYKYSDLLEE